MQVSAVMGPSGAGNTRAENNVLHTCQRLFHDPFLRIRVDMSGCLYWRIYKPSGRLRVQPDYEATSGNMHARYSTCPCH